MRETWLSENQRLVSQDNFGFDLAAVEDDLAESRAPEVRRAPHRGEQRADDAADAVDPCLKQTTSIYLPVPGSKVRRYKD